MSSNKNQSEMALATGALPTLYEYYTAGGITGGLNADQPHFTLNDRNVTLYSGAMHYFRVPRAYWRDRLRKMRAAGLNTVETYVPWNLHEPEPGKFDFGQGGTDMQDFLDMEEFLRLAKEEDLLAIVRPGPFICAEWEFGGMPSWLLRDDKLKVRTSDSSFMKPVTRYFNVLLPLLAALQFTKGGPIIAVQVENEYGSTESNDFVPDKVYLNQLKDLIRTNGIVELLVTSDSPTAHRDHGTIPGLLQTANFGSGAKSNFDALKELQPGRPTMSMEYWGGWFDHWSEAHHVTTITSFEKTLIEIFSYPASVNMYMFHGGTSFGFMNGANIADALQPDTTSYDYDAPLSEAGDYTEKYEVVVRLLKKYNQVQTQLPDRPKESLKKAYPDILIAKRIGFDDIIKSIADPVQSEKLIPMELLPINNNSGQSYGYITYRKTNVNIKPNSVLKIEGHVCDLLMVLINGKLMTKPLENASQLKDFGYWKKKDGELNLGDLDVQNATLDLVVENFGRNNFGYLTQFNEKKGLWQGNALLNGEVLSNWEIYPMEFRTKWINSLKGWKPIESPPEAGPALYSVTLNVTEVADTFIDMSGWGKGIVAVNGFVLGRHCNLGPQRFLYLPAPFLHTGDNEIVIFEHSSPVESLAFRDQPWFTRRTLYAPYNVPAEPDFSDRGEHIRFHGAEELEDGNH